MAYTSHGFLIPGTQASENPEDRPQSVARCGGPKICPDCAEEVNILWRHPAYRDKERPPVMPIDTNVLPFTVPEPPEETSTGLDLQTFTRRPFNVEAVRVTHENFEAVAAWTGSSIVTSEHTNAKGEKYTATSIHVDVKNALHHRQARAYVGDWVLKMPHGFKVYTNKAFRRSFVPAEV